MPMRLSAVVALLVMVLAAPLLAGERHVVADRRTDFTTLRTFSIEGGRATTTRAELNNMLVMKIVGEALRTQLTVRGLQEAATNPDVVVRFTLGQDRPNGPSVTFDEAVMVVEVRKRDTDRLIWHGTWRDGGATPAKFAEQAPLRIKDLLTAYPPRKK